MYIYFLPVLYCNSYVVPTCLIVILPKPRRKTLCYTPTMKKLALKIRGERTDQYADMAEKVGAPELLASPLGAAIKQIAPVTLAGQGYMGVTIDEESIVPPCPALVDILPRLGATSEAYEFFEHIGDVAGPFLRPLETVFTPFIPLVIAEVRRYKCKTNVCCTRVLLNIAIFAGAYSNQFTERLRVLDPLAGGGTTLFLALAPVYDAFRIQHQRPNVKTADAFLTP